MALLARVFAICGLLTLAACGGGPDGPQTGAAAGWKISGASIRFGPEISPTAPGTEYRSNFVWDGYSGGNRKRQVVGLFRAAISDVAGGMSGSKDVSLNVVVTKFHALTRPGKTWCCGEHNIVANLAVIDPTTGAVLASQDNVYLGRLALGGIPGLVAEAAGRDQIVRVREGIADGIADWLGTL